MISFDCRQVGEVHNGPRDRSSDAGGVEQNSVGLHPAVHETNIQ